MQFDENGQMNVIWYLHEKVIYKCVCVTNKFESIDCVRRSDKKLYVWMIQRSLPLSITLNEHTCSNKMVDKKSVSIKDWMPCDVQ